MSGDLEDFLKRAAQRRRQQIEQQQAQQPKPRPRPEYTDSRAERTVRAAYDQSLDNEPLKAEVIDADLVAETLSHVSDAVPPVPQTPSQPTPAELPRPAAATVPDAKVDLEQLMEWMRTPSGLKQAVVIREILDRPTHRWD